MLLRNASAHLLQFRAVLSWTPESYPICKEYVQYSLKSSKNVPDISLWKLWVKVYFPYLFTHILPLGQLHRRYRVANKCLIGNGRKLASFYFHNQRVPCPREVRICYHPLPASNIMACQGYLLWNWALFKKLYRVSRSFWASDERNFDSVISFSYKQTTNYFVLKMCSFSWRSDLPLKKIQQTESRRPLILAKSDNGIKIEGTKVLSWLTRYTGTTRKRQKWPDKNIINQSRFESVAKNFC